MRPSSAPLGLVVSRRSEWWQRLVRPASSLGEPQRRRARLLTSLLLVLIPVGPLADALRLIVNPAYRLLDDPGWMVMVGTLGGLIVLYVLSRTERSVLATRLTVVLIMSGTWAAALVSRTSYTYDVPVILIFLTLGVLLSSVLLSVRDTILLSLASLGSFLLLPVVAPEIALGSLLVPLLITGSLASLLIIAAVLRQQDQAQMEHGTAQLRESEENFRVLFRNNPHPMWVYDLQTLRFLEVNDAAVERYGYSRAEFHQMQISDIRPREEVPRLLANIQAGRPDLERGEAWSHQSKDGRKMDVEITSHTLEYDGHSAVLVVAFDVTERKRLQNQLHQAQKMEAFGQLAGGVAHDFNNLLTVINGFSELLIDQDSLTEQQRDAVNQIALAGASATSLTRQLLAFSRQEVIAPKVIDLNGTVEQLSRMLQRIIGEDVSFSVVLEPSLGTIRADHGQMEQILLNLAANARDAMPRGGRLTIETANVDIDGMYAIGRSDVEPGPHVMLSVSDSGVGMDAALRARIFEPFFTTKDVGKGTGLGLAAVHGIVKQNGGWIDVYSELGVGTIFKVYFPRIATPALRDQATEAMDRGPGGSETILVAEDDARLRALSRTALEGSGYTILEACDGEDALAVAKTHVGPIHLLLTDVVMPKLGGRLLAEQLSLRYPTMKVIFLSGYTDDMVIRHGVVNGTVEFLQKPFTLLALNQKVRHTLDVA